MLLVPLFLVHLAIPAIASGSSVTFSGGGWGAGVGLSQYGGRAMADAGAAGAEILSHYYPGTTVRHIDTLGLGTAFSTGQAPLWVGLLQNQPVVTFRIEVGSADLCFDDTGICVAAGAEGQSWRFGPDASGLCNFSRQAGQGGFIAFEPSGGCAASARPTSENTIFEVPRKARSYSNATLRIRESEASGRLHLSVQLGIEDYVRGVQELPEVWPGEVLEAQAIVSRTLAVRRVLDIGDAVEFDSVRLDLCACHVLDNDKQQAFGGLTAVLGHPSWQGRVGATVGQVLSWNNEVILARFSSSTGGRTESNEATGGSYYPYLVSVDDSASLSSVAANPFAKWSTTVDHKRLGNAFGFSWLSGARVVSRYSSESAALVELKGIVSGRPAAILVTGPAIRDALGLRSTYFDIQVIPRFNDVRPGHPFAGEVLGLSDLGITSGCTEISFCPTDAVTREQMAAFLVRALELEGPSEAVNLFVDDDGSLFETEIETLYHNGITSGCTATAFCPLDVVTREQMAAFLVRGFSLTSPATPSEVFEDDDGSFFEADIETLYYNGVTSGCTATSFCPSEVVTREQMAGFMIRALAIPVDLSS
mgnify:CR=1 FL=1